MRLETQELLLDMQNVAERIARFSHSKTFGDYAADEYFRSAVERQFEIIGEAMVRLIKSDQETAKHITDHRKIAGFRNVLIHGYDAIDDAVTWGTVTGKLPALRDELRRLLAEG